MIRFATIFVITICIALVFVLGQSVTRSQEAPVTKNIRVFVIKAKLTGYDACGICCGVFSKHKKTSTGVDARKPIGVAAAPTFVPYGSQVFIPGLATNALRIVDDTGGGMRRHARKGGVQFDVRFTTHQQAKKFGVRYTNVFIVLEDPTPEQIARFEKMAIFSHETEAMSQTEAIQITEQQFALAE